MSNSILEFLNCIDEDKKLSELIKGKRVCLCGPAKSNIGLGYGEYIDNFDTVCRINWHLTGKNGWDQNLISDFGKRTDIMFTGFRFNYDYNNIKNMKYENCIFHCFKDIKYMYFIDPVNLEEYQIKNKKYFEKMKDLMICDIKDYENYIKKLNVDYGIINCWLSKNNNVNFMKNKMNLPVNNKNSVTNSGFNSIEIILRHKPKELFITGMNFGNFGKGETLSNLYADSGHSKLQLKMDKFKMYKKKWNIHTSKETLKFLKKIINENDNIILDNILKKYFN